MTNYKTGTICIAPGDKTTMAFAPNDTARVKPLNFDEPARLDLNAYVIQIAKAVAPCIDSVARIVVYEPEPRSRDEADRVNFLKRAITIIARTRGLELVATHEIHLEVLHDPKPLFPGLPVSEELGPVNALRLEAFRRKAIEAGVPFGTTLLRCDCRKHRSERQYLELLGIAALKRFAWHGYCDAREDAIKRNASMWQYAEGV